MKSAKLFTLLVGPLFTVCCASISPAWAADNDGTFADSFKELGKSLDQMSHELKKGMDQAEKAIKKAGEGLHDLKPSHFGFADDKMYPEDQLTREVRELKSPTANLKSVDLGSRFAEHDVEFVTSPGSDLTLSVLVLADPDFSSQAKTLAEALTTDIVDGQLKVSDKMMSYRCFQYRFNGTLSLKGACYSHVTVALPAGTDISIYLKGKLLHGPRQPLTSASLIEKLSHQTMTSGDQIALVEEFVKQVPADYKLSAQELKDILSPITFNSTRMEALEKLAPLLKGNDRLAFAKEVTSLFTFASDQAQAYQILLNQAR